MRNKHVIRRAKIVRTATGGEFKCMASRNKRAMALEGRRTEYRRGEKVSGRVSRFQAGVHMGENDFLRAQETLTHLRKMEAQGGTSCASEGYFHIAIKRLLKAEISSSKYLREYLREQYK